MGVLLSGDDDFDLRTVFLRFHTSHRLCFVAFAAIDADLERGFDITVVRVADIARILGNRINNLDTSHILITGIGEDDLKFHDFAGSCLIGSFDFLSAILVLRYNKRLDLASNQVAIAGNTASDRYLSYCRDQTVC